MSDRFFYMKNQMVLGYRGYDTAIVIPQGAVKIGDNAFQYHPIIERVEIPEGVKRIGFYAFRGCRKLTEIVMPNSVKKIDKHAFEGCEALQKVTYHGVTFRKGEKPLEEIFRIVDTKDFSCCEDWKTEERYALLWAMFSGNPEDKEILALIKKNFVKMFRYLIDQNDTQTAEKVLHESKLINKRNLESITKYAVEKENTAFQELLKQE